MCVYIYRVLMDRVWIEYCRREANARQCSAKEIRFLAKKHTNASSTVRLHNFLFHNYSTAADTNLPNAIQWNIKFMVAVKLDRHDVTRERDSLGIFRKDENPFKYKTFISCFFSCFLRNKLINWPLLSKKIRKQMLSWAMINLMKNSSKLKVN